MRFLAIALALMGAGGANAAELPSRETKAPSRAPEKARRCDIGGAEGFLLANGTCVRIGGEITVGVQGGKLR